MTSGPVCVHHSGWATFGEADFISPFNCGGIKKLDVPRHYIYMVFFTTIRLKLFSMVHEYATHYNTS